MGSLELRLSVDGVLQNTDLFSRSGDQGNMWIEQNVVIPPQNGNAYQVIQLPVNNLCFRVRFQTHLEMNSGRIIVLCKVKLAITANTPGCFSVL